MDNILYQIVRDDAWKKFASIEYRSRHPKVDVEKKYKISICTTCMGRKGDVQQTLEKNIMDNSDYDNVEFVLLDYNSKDGLAAWVRTHMVKYIEEGILNYYRTSEPEFYSMTHSRNVAFKVAQGDIVNNVDGDHFTNKGFASFVNLLANIYPERAVFVKSKQKNRGRLGLYKEEFVNMLGGYNEDIEDYGYDDADLLHRAAALDFVAVRYGGKYCTITPDHRRHPTDNYKNRDWRYTQRRNTLISLLTIAGGYYKANRHRHWGKATLVKNFSEEVIV